MSFKKIFKFIDQNILLFLSLFLMAFIPLYPKWPLFDILPGYQVRVRLDDFLVLFTCLIYLIKVLRGKIKLNKIPLTKPILIYLAIGLLSTLSAIFITKTVYFDTYQIAKVFLHYFRRIEYFSLFFIFYSSITKKEQIKYFVYVLLLTIFSTFIYGIGQKYWYWPAYSTMNREFSKGIRLYLMEGSRVLSTFAGHYDLAAYISLTLPIILVLVLFLKNKFAKILLSLLLIMDFWLLNLTVSRSSFISLLGAFTIMFFLFLFKKPKKWVIPRYISILLISFTFMFSGPLAERFSQVINLKEIKANIEKKLRPPAPPENGIALNDTMSFEEQLEKVSSDSDVPPRPAMPADVAYAPPIEEVIATISADNEATYTVVVKDRTFSDFALKYGLSMGIRFDTLWPQAIKGFKTNPLLGSGYSTLTKSALNERTTAESTDSDYLRLIGEVGLLGAISYLYIFYVCIDLILKSSKKVKNDLNYGLLISGIGMIASFMINALTIDVWEASKVAYTFWGLMGVFLASIQFLPKTKTKAKSKK